MPIVYECPKVRKLVLSDPLAFAKVNALFVGGSRIGNNGRIALLKADHAHITGGSAVAFRWDGDDLEIVGYGVKGKGKPVAGSGGYSWTAC